jgi:hypothetical protein
VTRTDHVGLVTKTPAQVHDATARCTSNASCTGLNLDGLSLTGISRSSDADGSMETGSTR